MDGKERIEGTHTGLLSTTERPRMPWVESRHVNQSLSRSFLP